MYTFESRVRYSEVDLNKNITVTKIIDYLQDCSTFQSEDLGIGIDYLSKRGRAWLLSSWQIVIERYPKLGEKIVVGTWPYDFKGIYGLRNFTIQDGDGNYLVKANSKWFLFDTNTGRPTRVEQEDLGNYMEKMESKLDMDYIEKKIVLPKDMESRDPLTVMKHRIDTNHHMNNAQYVDIAKEFVPEELSIRQIRVEYKKMAMLGDEIYPRFCKMGKEYFVSLENEKKEPYAIVFFEEGEDTR